MGLTAEQVYALAKKYTTDTVEGAGAIKGKNCTISSITPIEGGNRITFEWELDNGTTQTDTLDVMDGEKGDTGDKGDKGDTGKGIASIQANEQHHLIITYDDGTTQDAGVIESLEYINANHVRGGTLAQMTMANPQITPPLFFSAGQLRNIALGVEDLTAGTSPLNAGDVYISYEL